MKSLTTLFSFLLSPLYVLIVIFTLKSRIHCLYWLEAYHKHKGVFPISWQSHHLFSKSVYDNLTYRYTAFFYIASIFLCKNSKILNPRKVQKTVNVRKHQKMKAYINRILIFIHPPKQSCWYCLKVQNNFINCCPNNILNLCFSYEYNFQRWRTWIFFRCFH